ncbi:hypothetical protein L228DRAFT_166922 [Xylona heveae TC161]|uniref:F-box domain-containing protein n=1 Tax=Xylona heveae (strain CBS 132557 / TC161) TaxID=1328760 RepID=A0A165FLX4_XYLHT|nr:hypothetical protein L228DRAFT_166922 [Xylona heveae TC161]KZF21134.1 hypothetical protein L228DRAFT_166922 [Xylona heveae TC161]
MEHLPTELRDIITSQLSISDLSALSRTSKCIRRHIEPLLYRKVEWTWDESRPHPPFYKQVRTILHRPDLGAKVERINLRGKKPRIAQIKRGTIYRPDYRVTSAPSTCVWKDEDWSETFWTRRKDLEAGYSLINSLQLSAGTSYFWKEALDQGEVDMFLSLLLLHTSGLRSLCLGQDFQSDTRYVGVILNRALNGMSGFHHFEYLETVEYCTDMGDARYEDDYTAEEIRSSVLFTADLDQILPLFYSPSIRSISMAIHKTEVFWPRNETPCSALTRLVLHHTQLREEDLGHLLIATPKLRSLEYHVFADDDSRNAPFRYSLNNWLLCSKLSTALRHVRHSLKQLWISSKTIDYQGISDCGPPLGRLEPMKDFLNLETLAIPAVLLGGEWKDSPFHVLAEFLPPNLKELRLSDEATGDCAHFEMGDLILHLEHYLRTSRSSTPSLQSLTVRTDRSRAPELQQKLKGLEKISADVGISLQLKC